MKNFQITLRIKKSKFYSERVVELTEKSLKYFKKENPSEIRFQANLNDIIYYEKYKNDKAKYKLVISSKSNSFPMIKFKSLSKEDVNPLLVFKTQLENFINFEKIGRNKKQSIIMRVAQQENVGINNSEEQNLQKNTINDTLVNSLTGHRLSSGSLVNKNFRHSSYSISSVTNKFTNNKTSDNKISINTQEENFKMNFMKSLENFDKEFQIFNKDDPKFQNIFNEIEGGKKTLQKYDFKNGVEIFTSDKRKLDEIYYSNKIQECNNFILQENFSMQFNTHKWLNYFILVLLFLVIIYSLYIKNFIQIVFSLFIYFYLKFEFLKTSKNNSFENKNFDFQSLFEGKTCSLNRQMEGDKMMIKSQAILNFNLFTVCDLLINEKSYKGYNYTETSHNLENKNYQEEYFYNLSNKSLVIAEFQNNDLINLYQLESNEHMSKTRVIFFNLVNNKIKLDETYIQMIRSRIERLENFINLINHKLRNEKFFDGQISKEVDHLILSKFLSDSQKLKIEKSNENKNLDDKIIEEKLLTNLNESEIKTFEKLPENQITNTPNFKNIDSKISPIQNKLLHPYTNFIKISDQALLKEKLNSILKPENLNLGLNDEYIISTLKKTSKKKIKN
jgi:hypothetical protein